jgi:adenylate kinase family enzyme
MTSRSNRVVAIFGPPGAGKTTVAKALADELGRTYISSGDVARAIDPGSIARGEMADRFKLQQGFKALLDDAIANEEEVIVDGLPRDPGDVAMLDPEQTLFILLNARSDILIDRQLRRGRPGDEDTVVVTRRTFDQRELMGLNDPHGWAFGLVTHVGALNTGDKTRDQVYTQVREYVLGQRKTVA